MRSSWAAVVVALVLGSVGYAPAQDYDAPADQDGAVAPVDEAEGVMPSAPPPEGLPAEPEPQAAPNRVQVPTPPAPGAPSPAVTAGPNPGVLGRRFPSPLQIQPEREPPEVSISIVSPGESGLRRPGRPGADGGAEGLDDDGMGEGMDDGESGLE